MSLLKRLGKSLGMKVLFVTGCVRRAQPLHLTPDVVAPLKAAGAASRFMARSRESAGFFYFIMDAF